MYDYPLDMSWSTEEIIQVVSLYNAVEKAYEEGIAADEFLSAYEKYARILGSRSEMKKYERLFKEASTYSIYTVYKEAMKGGFIKV